MIKTLTDDPLAIIPRRKGSQRTRSLRESSDLAVCRVARILRK
jgi:hypothetical protein